MLAAKYGIPVDARLVLFLGRLSEKKSPELLLEAFAQLPAELENRAVWLAFAGPDESGMLHRLEELARARGVRARVVFSGAIFEAEKWAAYCDADVFVLPSQNENFGNTALEAAACGTPAVITENYASLFDPIEALTLAAAKTSKIKLGTSIIDALFHPPAVLARRFMTLDQFSGGRASLAAADRVSISFAHRA